MKDLDCYESQLEAEDLAVIEVDTPYSETNIKQIKGKWKRLDARINGLEAGSAEIMSNSPYTVRAVKREITDSDDERFESQMKRLERESENDFDFYNSGLGVEFFEDDDDDGYGESPLDDLISKFIATPKEAEIADRARGAIYGLDEKGRPQNGVIGQKKGESLDDYFDRLDQIQQGSTDLPGPEWKPWRSPNIPPHATSDAGNGPLSIKQPIGPDPLSAPDTDEPVRMSPVVDTLGYLPGRSPFQMSRITQNNSDITG